MIYAAGLTASLMKNLSLDLNFVKKLMLSKTTLREHFKQNRACFVREHLSVDFESKFLIQFEELFKNIPLSKDPLVIAAYYPMVGEASPLSILSFLQKNGIITALPRIHQTKITFCQVTKDTILEKSPYGFFQPVLCHPVLPDIILAPLLAFDQNGHRLGYGKGHYDRVISQLKEQKKLIIIGLAFPCQQIESLPFEEHDEKLDAVLLPHTYIVFNRDMEL